jgi:AcrR family transcriptional regulator
MAEATRRDRERAVREAVIVAAAEMAYRRKGFEAASMDEIAKDAEFTKRTVYKYFRSKEDLFLAVVLKGFRAMTALIAEATGESGTGFEKARALFRALYGYFRTQPEAFELISHWNYVRKRSASESQDRDSLNALNQDIFRRVAATLREGVEDGSIRPDLAVESSVYSLVFLITGFLMQLSIIGESFTRQFDLDPETFGLDTIDMVLKTLAPARTRH